MQLEQTVSRKRLVKSDMLLFVITVITILGAMLLLSFLQYLKMIGPTLQIAVFAVLLAFCYLIITRQLTSFSYVLHDATFCVYRLVGKKKKLMEQVLLHEVIFVAPYLQAKGERGRENALCATKKQEAIVVAHKVNDKRQWLIVNIAQDMQDALKQAAQVSARSKYD